MKNEGTFVGEVARIGHQMREGCDDDADKVIVRDTGGMIRTEINGGAVGCVYVVQGSGRPSPARFTVVQ